VASPGVVLATAAEQRFRREAERAPVEPRPQDDAAYDDRIDARLAAMQASTPHVSAGVAVAAPTSLWGGAPATISGPSGGGPAVTLTRGAGLGGSPLPLARGGGGVGTAPAPAVAPAPRVDAEAATPAGGDAQARRTLAGATLMGPIADRAVLTHVTPVYPEWAKRDAVEGSVTLYFVVAPDGSVRENVVVQKTAGFGDFDENARAALRAWRFAPLTDGRVGEQWGTITFRFRLRDAG